MDFEIASEQDATVFTLDDLSFSRKKQKHSKIKMKKFLNIAARHGNGLGKLMNLFLFGKWPKGKVLRLNNTLIELPDGAKLSTDIFIPKFEYENNIKVPAILIRTPYWKDTLAIAGYAVALKGYAAVFQDIRGAAKSNPYGNNSFFFSERDDGLITAKWIHNQPWFNGKLGMWGLSYMGMCQWAVSYDNEGLFTALNPAQSSPLMLWAAHNGLDPLAISLDIFQIFHEVTGFEEQMSAHRFHQESTHKMVEKYITHPFFALYNDPIDQSNYKFDIEETHGKSVIKDREMIMERLGIDFSIRDFPRFLNLMNTLLVERNAKIFSKYMMGMLDFDWSKLEQPVLILGSWYDMFAKVSVDAFMEMQKFAPKEIAEKSRMIIGPWVHIDKKIDYFKHLINVDWFEYQLNGKINHFETNPPIKIFVMGRNKWRYEHEWPLKRTKYREIYLGSIRNSRSRSGDGFLSWESDEFKCEYDEFMHNPMDPVLTRGGNHLHLPKGRFEQTPIESRNDVLVFSTPPLGEGIEITGNIKVILYASSDCEDTDFMVKLCDVSPRGKSYNLLQRGIRARYRNGVFRPPQLINPGKIYRYEFELGATSNYFKRGHQIRVCVYSSDYPKYNINANLGGRGPEGAYKIAKQKIYHNPEYPSHLILPIIED